MSWGSPEFVLVIIALSTAGWLVNNWIRARHGYALEDEWGGKTARAADDRDAALASQNRELKELVGMVSERVQVLERIVTERGYDVATQIEALRDGRRAEALIDHREPEVRS